MEGKCSIVPIIRSLSNGEPLPLENGLHQCSQSSSFTLRWYMIAVAGRNCVFPFLHMEGYMGLEFDGSLLPCGRLELSGVEFFPFLR